eukprot:2700253-Pyramimonas_sp.AAC.1
MTFLATGKLSGRALVAHSSAVASSEPSTQPLGVGSTLVAHPNTRGLIKVLKRQTLAFIMMH